MEKINNKEAISLVVALCTNVTILLSSQVIINDCSSGSLINSCLISLIAIALTLVICSLYRKFIGLNILDISEYLGGKTLKTIIGIIFIIYFLFTSSILLYRLINCLKIIYYPITNIVYTVLLFIIAVGIICNLGNNAFSKANYIILPLSLLTIILAFIGNAENFDYENVFPIFGNSINHTFITGISNLFTFGGINYLFFLPSKLKNPNKFLRISVLSIVISSIVLLFIVTTILFMFNANLVEGQLFPFYSAVRYIEFGTFFQRLDSAFLLIRIISFISFLSITSNLCLNIFKEIINTSDEKPIIYPFMLLLFSCTLLPETIKALDSFHLQNNIFKFLFFITFALGMLILIFAKFKKNRKESSL